MFGRTKETGRLDGTEIKKAKVSRHLPIHFRITIFTKITHDDPYMVLTNNNSTAPASKTAHKHILQPNREITLRHIWELYNSHKATKTYPKHVGSAQALNWSIQRHLVDRFALKNELETSTEISSVNDATSRISSVFPVIMSATSCTFGFERSSANKWWAVSDESSSFLNQVFVEGFLTIIIKKKKSVIHFSLIFHIIKLYKKVLLLQYKSDQPTITW